MMKPATRHVLELLLDSPDGLCFVDFARQPKPIPRVAARIHELKHDHDYWIDTSPCKRHRHEGRAVKYSIHREAAA